MKYPDRLPQHLLLVGGLLITLCLLMGGNLLAQSSRLHLAYAGNNLWNPGLSLTWDQPLQWQSNGTHTWWRFVQGGIYVDPRSHTGLYATAGISREKPFKEAAFWTIQVAPIGLYRSFLPTTYEVGVAGRIDRVILPGRWYLSPTAQLTVGKLLPNTKDKAWYVGVKGMLLLPYNTYVLPLLFVEAGVRL